MIECRNLFLTWGGSGAPVEAVHDLSFVANEGEIVAIIGPSGCGKTSSLAMLAGLERPDKGEMFVDGAPITGPSPERGVIFQTPHLFPWLSVEGNVEFGLKMKGLDREARSNLTHEILRYVGLFDWRNRYPHELSGGMKQRVALARVLVNEPRILLVDEPLTSLDRQTRIYMMQHFFLRERDKRNLIVLYVTHYVDEALLFSNKVLVLSARPATVLEEVAIELDYPRDATSPQFHEYWLHLTKLLQGELEKTFDRESSLYRTDVESSLTGLPTTEYNLKGGHKVQ